MSHKLRMGDTFMLMKRGTRDGAAAVFAASVTFIVLSLFGQGSEAARDTEVCTYASSFLGAEPQRVMRVAAEEVTDVAVSDGQDTVWLNADNGELVEVTFHEDATRSTAQGVSPCAP